MRYVSSYPVKQCREQLSQKVLVDGAVLENYFWYFHTFLLTWIKVLWTVPNFSISLIKIHFCISHLLRSWFFFSLINFKWFFKGWLSKKIARSPYVWEIEMSEMSFHCFHMWMSAWLDIEFWDYFLYSQFSRHCSTSSRKPDTRLSLLDSLFLISRFLKKTFCFF